MISAIGVLSGCTMTVDAPQTPTLIVSPTLDATAIARLATRTLTPTDSATLTATNTATATVTQTATQSPSATATPTATLTRTSTSTSTPTLTPPETAKPTSTSTATATRTATRTQIAPSATRTSTPAATATATVTRTATRTVTATQTTTPTPGIEVLAIPTATARATATFTPFPTITPNLTLTASGQTLDSSVPTATRTPGGIYTLTPSPPPTFTIQPEAPIGGDAASGDGTFYDPNAAAGGEESLPVAPEGDSGPTGSPLPEQDYIVVSYAGQIVPILPLPEGIDTGSALAQGDVFAVHDSAVAAVGYDRWLYVNGQRMTVSPSSEFGLHPNLSIGDLVWSPDGQRLAFRVDTSNPSDFNGIDSGIWIYEPATQRSWQVFRNVYQAAQQHEHMRALTVHWSPNRAALVVTVETGVGRGNVFMAVDHNANTVIPAISFADATWAPDSGSLIVSGQHWDSQTTVIGRIMLDTNWTYTEYLNQTTTGLVMQAAIQLGDGRIAFLGSSQGSVALYTMNATHNAPTTRVSQSIPGEVVTAEWNADRSAVLVTLQGSGGIRLWVIRTDGTARDTTPSAGTLTTAHWR